MKSMCHIPHRTIDSAAHPDGFPTFAEAGRPLKVCPVPFIPTNIAVCLKWMDGSNMNTCVCHVVNTMP